MFRDIPEFKIYQNLFWGGGVVQTVQKLGQILIYLKGSQVERM